MKMNHVDILQNVGTIFIVACTMAEYREWYYELRNLGVFVVLAQSIKALIDWMRLFVFTSFYVTLITRTVWDMLPFGMIMLILLGYFGGASFI